MATKHKPAPAATDGLAKLRRKYGCGPVEFTEGEHVLPFGRSRRRPLLLACGRQLSVGQVCLMDNPLLKADRLPRAHRRTDVPLHEPVGHAR
jgi:hypothetical protein